MLIYIYFNNVAFWDNKPFLLVPLSFKACILINCLVLGRANTVVQVLNSRQPFFINKTSSPSLYPSPNMTYMGFHHHLLTFNLNPPRVTEIPPLWWFLLIFPYEMIFYIRYIITMMSAPYIENIWWPSMKGCIPWIMNNYLILLLVIYY